MIDNSKNKIFNKLDEKHVNILVSLLNSVDYSCNLETSGEIQHLCDLELIIPEGSVEVYSFDEISDFVHFGKDLNIPKTRFYSLNNDWLEFLTNKTKSL